MFSSEWGAAMILQPCSGICKVFFDLRVFGRSIDVGARILRCTVPISTFFRAFWHRSSAAWLQALTHSSSSFWSQAMNSLL
jgi:hypothetical protein